ncbi:MAG: hypothetical protein JO111_09230 [Caulobacteraceae bacterium]|nr:hypothetical protein [Caulobacteraceae bacterium]
MLYSVHFFDGDGREDSWEELDCASEAEAINTMLDHATGRSAELWAGDRCLLWWPASIHRGRPTSIRPRAWRRIPIDAVAPVPDAL